jgi:hypothetical protein
MKHLHSVFFIDHEDAAFHAAGRSKRNSEFYEIAINSLGHLFRGMKGPEQLQLKTECLRCGNWAYASNGRKYEFVIGVGHNDQKPDFLGVFCDQCVDLPASVKNDGVPTSVGTKRK